MLPNGAVVTRDGKYLGIWQLNENDHPSFAPEGASGVVIFDVFIPSICNILEEWWKAHASTEMSNTSESDSRMGGRDSWHVAM